MNQVHDIDAEAGRTATDTLGQIGPLQVRLARTMAEIDAAQALRFRIFSTEFGAQFDAENRRLQRDRDGFDAVCDHLLVLDTTLQGAVLDQIVGTYRLSVSDYDAERPPMLYSQAEYDVLALMARNSTARVMELGRSCVLPAYRGRRTIELLWQGIWAYTLAHRADIMLGCASFAGTEPDKHALALSFLHHHASIGPPWTVSAHAEHRIDMNMMAKENVDMRAALAAMPPLIKGYLRLGAGFGDGAVIDHTFKTTDVLVVLPISAITSRYINHYGVDAQRFAR
ncbi:MAG: GNAT family N-acetyltransferase [Ahrensia sp.]